MKELGSSREGIVLDEIHTTKPAPMKHTFRLKVDMIVG